MGGFKAFRVGRVSLERVSRHALPAVGMRAIGSVPAPTAWASSSRDLDRARSTTRHTGLRGRCCTYAFSFVLHDFIVGFLYLFALGLGFLLNRFQCDQEFLICGDAYDHVDVGLPERFAVVAFCHPSALFYL